jgi:hypothetical protein
VAGKAVETIVPQTVPQIRPIFIKCADGNQRLYRAFLDFFALAMWSKSFKKEMNEFLTDISRVIESQIDPLATGEAGSAQHPPTALATLILGATFGLAMQYLMNPERDEILNGFDILLCVV